MNSKSIIKRLKKMGSSTHIHPVIIGSSRTRMVKIVVVPNPKKDIPIGTLRNIFRQAGWEWRQK